jgi:type IV pilus assembly protein PilB
LKGGRQLPQSSERTPRRKPRRPLKKSESSPSSTTAEKTQTGNLFDLEISSEVLSLIPRSFAKQHSVFPLEKKGNRLTVAMANPGDYAAINEMRLITGLLIRPQKAHNADIQQLIVRDYPSEISLDGLSDSLVETIDPEGDSKLDDSPIVKLVNTLLQDAVDRGASDIHFDPQEKGLVVRLRVDGELRTHENLPKSIQTGVTSRLKIISSLDITETRVPQDGRAMIRNGGNVVDLRVSVLPVIHGEKIVIRVLDRSSGIRRLDEFRFEPKVLATFKAILHKPHGIILVTGPTGSGKSTTLAAMLDYLNDTKKTHILTLEDPIEYIHNHKKSIVAQREVGSDTMSFGNGLRAALRQDPDVILVGELRDFETISIALTAAETGHLVLGTLHTSSAPATIERIVDVFPADQQTQIRTQLAGALLGILSQRLLPTIDGNGRVAATEMMLNTRGIASLIRQGKTHQIHNMLQMGKNEGMHTMSASLEELVAAERVDADVADNLMEEGGE